MLINFINTYGELSDSNVTSFCYNYGDVMSPVHILPSIEMKVYCHNKIKVDYENIWIRLNDVLILQLNDDSINRQIFAVKDALISEADGFILLDFNPIDHFTHLEENPDSRFKIKCKSLEYKIIS